MGDPAGIGPEIIVKAFLTGAAQELCTPFVMGDAALLRKTAGDLHADIRINVIGSPSAAAAGKGVLDVLDLANVDLARHRWGKPDASCGAAAVAYIRTAADLALTKRIAALVTAPISKEMMNAAGFPYAGHTELLAEATGTREFGMLFVGGGLRVILATIHEALRDVPKLMTRERVLSAIRLGYRAVRQFGIAAPRIGVAALNPHAGEGGLFGSEDEKVIAPAAAQARREGIDASDPVPADTLFHKALRGAYDLVVAMYHDQGLAPLKMIAFGRSVNVTVGLPIIRTSVDHGTAYDIAGTGRADPASLIEAIRIAVQLALAANPQEDPHA